MKITLEAPDLQFHIRPSSYGGAKGSGVWTKVPRVLHMFTANLHMVAETDRVPFKLDPSTSEDGGQLS